MRRFILFLILTSLLSALPAREPSLRDLDELTARWIALRGTLAEERRQWEKRKAAWEEEIDLLEEESAALAAELESGREVLSTAEERRAAVLARKEASEAELRKLDAGLAATRREAESWRARVPASLRDQLPALSGEGGRTREAQRLAAYLSAIESLHNRIHGVRETVEVDGQSRQVDVMYLGLARGFAVSPKNDWAAIGVPTDNGWSWSGGGVDPEQVRKLVEVYHQRETAALATVPLAVEETP